MYLLHTITLELRYFHDPLNVQYAALSHVWQDDDHTHTFRDIKDIQARCLRTREDPRSLVTPKVRQLCILAASEGYEWVWIDTCCIDKSSSAELSEAINSMYSWYEAADVCYVFLFDVCDGDDPFAPTSEFRRSKWHTRGWTLQELLAPRHAVFLSSSWYRVGTKSTLASVLVEFTGIDRETLLWGSRDTNNHWKDMTSVAQRMSWAANRVTTRTEDRAYSLMGIFGVTMPVIYGEGGEQAFLRLQKEVINVCPDQTIFAWGPIHSHFGDAVNDFQWPWVKPSNKLAENIHRYQRLFALSPDDFAQSGDVRPLAQGRYMRLFGHHMDLKCAFAANGTTLHLPVSSEPVRVLGGQFVDVAPLACTMAADEDAIIFLFLTRTDTFDSAQPQELVFRTVGSVITVGRSRGYYRGASLRLPKWNVNEEERRSGLPSPYADNMPPSLCPKLVFRQLRIDSSPTSYSPVHPERLSRTRGTPHRYVFEVPHWVLHRLAGHGFVLQPSMSMATGVMKSGSCCFTVPGRTSSHLDDQPVFSMPFVNIARAETLLLSFGVGCSCRAFSQPHDEWIHPDHWWIKVSLDLSPGAGDLAARKGGAPESKVRDLVVADGFSESKSSAPGPLEGDGKLYLVSQTGQCTNVHLASGEQSRDFAVTFYEDAGHRDPASAAEARAVLVRAPFSFDTSGNARDGIFTVMVDLVGFESVMVEDASLRYPSTPQTRMALVLGREVVSRAWNYLCRGIRKKVRVRKTSSGVATRVR